MPSTQSGTPVFGAFISYKRADEPFARMLEKALERYTPPKGLTLPQGHLNIFRDKEDLTGTEYHNSIQKYLDESAKLIVLCSPHARASSYVNDEIHRFAKGKSPSNIIPILLSGIPNNEAGPQEEAQKAFPDALCELMEIPLAADYRSFDPAKDRIDKGGFEGPWYTVLSNIYDISRSELEQRDKRRQARVRRVRMQLAAAVAIALVSLTVWALASRQEAVSRQLAASSISQLSIDPEQSILLAAEAVKTSKTDEAEEALRRALIRSHVRSVFRDHSDWVNDVSFSPSGRIIATASNDKTVRIVEVGSGKTLKVLQHGAAVRSVSFAPMDDSEILTVSDDNTRVWNSVTGAPISEMKGYIASFSPDARFVVTANNDGVRVWEAATGKLVWEQLSHPVNCASFSPDGGSVLICVDSVAQLWRVGSKTPVRTFQHGDIVTHAAFSSDGLLVVTASEDRTAKVWELASRTSWELKGHSREVIWAGFSSDGDRTVVTIGDKTARIWTMETAAQVRGHTDWITSADISPDGRLVVTTSQDGTARVWDTKTGLSVVDLLGHTDSVFKARFSPDGKSVATVSADRTMRIWDVTVGVELRGHTDWVTSAALDHDGRRVVTTSWDGTARIWDAETGATLAKIEPQKGGLNKAAFSPDGRFVVLAGVYPVARIWDIGKADTDQILTGHATELYTAAYSHDGARVITAGGQDGMVKIWDSATGQEESSYRPNGDLVTSASFSPDDRYILTTGADQTARIMDRRTQESVVFRKHTGIVYSGAFSPDGMLVVTSSGDMTARVWEAHTGRQISLLSGHTARLTDAEFSPNGRLIVTASADKTARVWESATGRALAVFENHADLVSSASFTPDGRRVLTSSDDGTAKIVDCNVCEASIEELIDLARTRVTRELLPEQRSSRMLKIFGF